MKLAVDCISRGIKTILNIMNPQQHWRSNITIFFRFYCALHSNYNQYTPTVAISRNYTIISVSKQFLLFRFFSSSIQLSYSVILAQLIVFTVLLSTTFVAILDFFLAYFLVPHLKVLTTPSLLLLLFPVPTFTFPVVFSHPRLFSMRWLPLNYPHKISNFFLSTGQILMFRTYYDRR
jgi:hypothetical protein